MNCIVHGITKSQTRQSDFHFLLLDPVTFYEAVRCLFDLGHIIYLWVKLYLNDSIPNHADEIIVVVKASLLFICFYMQYPSLDLQAFETRVQRSNWLQNSFSLPSHFIIVSKPFENKLREQLKLLITQSCPALWDPMDCSPPGSSVHGFSRQEYRSGLLFPSPGDLPDPRIEPRSPALQADSLLSEPLGKPLKQLTIFQFILCALGLAFAVFFIK